MLAAVVRELDPILSHAVDDLPEPVSWRGEVLGLVKAAAVNFAGIVSSLVEDVKGLKADDRVSALAEQGRYAQRVAVTEVPDNEKACYKISDGMSLDEAASMALVYDTSWVGGVRFPFVQPAVPEARVEYIDEIFSFYEAGNLRSAPYRTVPIELFELSLQDVVDRRSSTRIVPDPILKPWRVADAFPLR